MTILEEWTWPVKAGVAYRVEVTPPEGEPPGDDLAAVARWFGRKKSAAADIPVKSACLRRTRTGWEETFVAPPKASTLHLALHHWEQIRPVRRKGGFRAALREVPKPAPRTVTFAVAYQRYPEESTVECNVAIMREIILQAGREKVDLLCLTETFPDRAVHPAGLPQPLRRDDPALRPIFDAAREAGLYTVFSFHEQTGAGTCNTALLVSPEGEIAGSYRKTHLPVPELDQGIVPGEEFPVFDTPIGKIGILICWDAWFSESARALARRGAEIVCLPLAGDQYERHWRHVWPARAMDHQVFWLASVTANCVLKAPSAIYAPSGKMLASTRTPNGFARAAVTLPAATETPWLLGAPSVSEFRNVIETSRLPRSYE